MIVDSSALIAVLLDEPDADDIAESIRTATIVSMSSATYLETSMVLLRRTDSPTAYKNVDELIAFAGIEIEPVLFSDSQTARSAFEKFGKGRHPAAINFGDCFTYALARRLDRPILCKGNDFARTDVAVAPLP